jgi:hypothetical protein
MRFLLGVFLVCSVMGHSSHSSIAQLDYVTSRKSLEAIVWLHTEDLERVFKEQTGPRANFDDPKVSAPFVRNYLRTHFALRDLQGKLLEPNWVGLEIKVHFVAAYFEVALPHGLSGLTLTNSILFDRLPDQTNSVQVQQDGRSLNEVKFDRAGSQPLLNR